jgi:hypothetical protein
LSVLFFLVGTAGFHSPRTAAIKVSDSGELSFQMRPLHEQAAHSVQSNASASAPPGKSQPTGAAKGLEKRARAAAGASTPEGRAQELCGGNWDVPSGSWIPLSAIKASCFRVVEDNGRQFMEQFSHNLPRGMFIFLPLLALLMKPLYWRPRRYYVEHLLFFVHDHAFAFLLLSVYWLVTALPLPNVLRAVLDLAVTLYLPYYLYRSMRRVYQQGHALTSLKFVTLAFVYLTFGGVMVALLSLYSFLTV